MAIGIAKLYHCLAYINIPWDTYTSMIITYKRQQRVLSKNKFINCGSIHNGVLFSHIKEWNYVVGREMDANGNYHCIHNKSNLESQVSCFLSFVGPPFI